MYIHDLVSAQAVAKKARNLAAGLANLEQTPAVGSLVKQSRHKPIKSNFFYRTLVYAWTKNFSRNQIRWKNFGTVVLRPNFKSILRPSVNQGRGILRISFLLIFLLIGVWQNHRILTTFNVKGSWICFKYFHSLKLVPCLLICINPLKQGSRSKKQ